MNEPQRCRNGHELIYPNVNVGWTGCKCVEPHRTWTCLTPGCRDVQCAGKPQDWR